MIKDRTAEHLATSYEERLLIIDQEDFGSFFDYSQMLSDLGYQIIFYDHIERFRLQYESELKHSPDRIAVLANGDLYIPYDIRKFFFEVELSLAQVYPRLNPRMVKRYERDLELIDHAYDRLYDDISGEKQTEEFIQEVVLSRSNIECFLEKADSVFMIQMKSASTYRDWIKVAQSNAQLEYYAAQIGVARDQVDLNRQFYQFVEESYSRLFGEVAIGAPPILTKTLDYITRNREERVALVVADGMSLFDYEVLVRHLQEFEIEEFATFAIVPTLTSFSRQSLLSGKYPRNLENPFTVTKEKNSYLQAMEDLGFPTQQIAYERGYDPDIGPSIRFVSIIVNTVDDLVHNQTQGRQGMFQDLVLWSESGQMQSMLSHLLESGFTVYLTADHGNTLCRGVGQKRGFGVETETKSKRVIILKDFAEADEDVKNRTYEYRGGHLDPSKIYLFSKDNTSFDNKDVFVMTHGGLSIEEVIVPFIKIKGSYYG